MIVKKLLLSIYFWIMFTLVTIVCILTIPIYCIISALILKQKLDYSIRWGIWVYGWILVRVVPFLKSVEVIYQTEDVPTPAIFASNHNSAIDPYLFAVMVREFCFITSWPFKLPIYNFFMHLAGYINANDGWEVVSEKAGRMLQSGCSILIWPEGHRSRDGRLGRFKNGAFALSVQTGYPIVPVCILGSGEFLPPGKWLMSPSSVKLVILDPVYPDLENDPEREIIRLRCHVRDVIETNLNIFREQS